MVIVSATENTAMQYPVSPEWQALEMAFEECLQLEGQCLPMAAHIQRLRAASEANTTHWGDQWQKHNAIRNYLKSWGVTP